MMEEKKTDDVDKLLSEEKSLEDRKQALIDDLLKQRETAIADFDEKLAKLGYKPNSDKRKRSHHKKASSGGRSPRAQSKPPATPAGDGSGKVISTTVPHKKR
jgi:hypothetical protein